MWEVVNIKGYWHIVALSVGVSVLSIYLNSQLLFLGLLLWLLTLYKFKRLGKIPVFISLTSFIFFYIHIPSIEELDNMTKDYSSETATIAGHIDGPVEKTKSKIEFRYQIDNSRETFLAVYYPNDQTENIQPDHLHTGASCQITGEVRLPDQSRNPGQFDYRAYLKTKGISHQFVINSLDDIHCEGSSFVNRIYTMRQKIQENILNKYSDDTAAWMIALVLGDDSLIGEDTRELFRNWGLSHLLAISGLHIGLIVGVVYFILMTTGLLTKEKVQWVMLIFLPVYALIAGGEPSVWRASMMVAFFIILSKWKVALSATDVISIVFLLLILFDNLIVYHVGFQFSFIVTFGLILSGRWLIQSSLFFQMLKISFVSQMVILPLQLIYFSFVQPLSILLNVIVVPYFSLFVIPGMFIMALLSPLPYIPTLFDQLFISTQLVMMTLVERVDHVMNYPWITGSFPVVLIFLYYLIFILFMSFVMKDSLKSAFKCGIALTVLITFVVVRPYFSPYGSVTMIDMGQGDTFIIELPYRKGVIFMDAGATFSFSDGEVSDRVFRQIIKPYLYYKGIQSIDAIIISHEDMDHMGSVNYITSEFNVNEIIISPYYKLDEATAEQWRNDGVNIRVAKQGEKLSIKDNVFNILSPVKDTGSENENSLVINTDVGGKSWLFTGDIGVNTEKELLKTYPHLSADVLKAGHHGSKTSTSKEFVQHINPHYALVSAGENNMYGHPAPEVIDTLKEEDVVILRTDLQGAVIYRFKGEQGTFYHYLP